MFYLFLLGFLIIYILAPIPIQIFLLALDTFIPDPIPAIDKILMMVILGNKIRKAVAIGNFVSKHKILTFLLVILFVFLLCVAISGIANLL